MRLRRTAVRTGRARATGLRAGLAGWAVVGAVGGFGAFGAFALAPAPAAAKPPPRAPAPTAGPAAPVPDAPSYTDLPPTVRQALQRAGIPAPAMVVAVHEIGVDPPRLQWQHRRPVNPASLTKLLTTAAALDRLGPAWTWTTPVWLAGPVQDGVLQGHLHLRGSGDPQLMLDKLWLLLRRVQAAGVRDIRGDIVLDGSAFSLPPGSAADFDGEPLRPYNVRPDALLLNHHLKTWTFRPDAEAGVARVQVDPPVRVAAGPGTVPLQPKGPCGDWRRTLQADFTAAEGVRFAGSYPLACGELAWRVADPEPASYNARLLQALWQDMGGRLSGQVRDGPAPEAPASFEWTSPPLAEAVREINKFSNNAMAQQLFLTLALQDGTRPATPEAARASLRRWLDERVGVPEAETAGTAEPAEPAAAGSTADVAQGLVIDNGSGLSRHTRVTAALLARVLLRVWDSPTMPELMASLPIAGLDGTLRRARVSGGRAHLKTGTLRDVQGLAGYVLSHGGRRYVLVGIVQHPQAGGARPALDALVQWVLHDTPQRATAP